MNSGYRIVPFFFMGEIYHDLFLFLYCNWCLSLINIIKHGRR
jgi:hypothetical protein